MARIAGIKTQKNTRGEITHVTIDVKKHQGVMLMLKELGVVSKTQFEKDCKGALTVEEARTRIKQFVKNLPWKK